MSQLQSSVLMVAVMTIATNSTLLCMNSLNLNTTKPLIEQDKIKLSIEQHKREQIKLAKYCKHNIKKTDEETECYIWNALFRIQYKELNKKECPPNHPFWSKTGYKKVDDSIAAFIQTFRNKVQIQYNKRKAKTKFSNKKIKQKNVYYKLRAKSLHI